MCLIEKKKLYIIYFCLVEKEKKMNETNNNFVLITII